MGFVAWAIVASEVGFWVVIVSGLLVLLIFWVGDPNRTQTLADVLRFWGIVLAVDGAIALSNFIWPKKARTG